MYIYIISPHHHSKEQLGNAEGQDEENKMTICLWNYTQTAACSGTLLPWEFLS